MSMDFILLFLVLYPMTGAIISYIIGRLNKNVRDYFADFVVLSELAIIAVLFVTYKSSSQLCFEVPGFAGMGLHFTLNGFRSVYILVAAIMWAMTTVFSKEYFAHYHNRNRYYMFMLMTYGATLGVFLSADLFTTFVFFEIMSFTSYVWVAHDEKLLSMKAAETYLAVAVIGGMVMLMGLFMLYHELGTLDIAALLPLATQAEHKGIIYASAICITIGFGAKAGAFPLHIWLPKAHPVAPAPASALLSGILTKSGVYGMLVVSCNLLYGNVKWGAVMLLLGTITMFGGALLAVFSIDLKRTLACSSMSQIGFIMIGIGMQGLLGHENALAARGTILHMVNHSLIKLVLFMVAGVVFMNLHKLNLNEIRGFGRKKPLLSGIMLMGALGIGGIPLWNGYVSKTLLHEAIVEYHSLAKVNESLILSATTIKCIEWIFLISGGMTIAYMTKLYIAIFVEKNNDEEKQLEFDSMKHYMKPASTLALTVSAVLLPLMGFMPGIIMDKLAERGIDLMHGAKLEESIHYFSLENLKGAAISIVIGCVLYFGVIRSLLMAKENGKSVYKNRWPKQIDLENYLYRPLIVVICAIGAFFARVADCFLDTIVVLLRKTVYRDSAIVIGEKEGTAFTRMIAGFLERRDAKRRKKDGTTDEDETKNHVHLLSLFRVSAWEEFSVISRTLSFGMMLCCLGLLITIIYLLFAHW